jgi:hypothetical protein
LHLVDGNLIELNQTVSLAHALFNKKNGIQVFHALVFSIHSVTLITKLGKPA